MAQATVILDRKGPLPIEINFNVTSTVQVLFVSGSVLNGTTNRDRNIGIDIIIDNNEIGEAEIWSNPTKQHMAVVPQYFVPKLKTGQHTLRIQETNSDTTGDRNDIFRALLLEL